MHFSSFPKLHLIPFCSPKNIYERFCDMKFRIKRIFPQAVLFYPQEISKSLFLTVLRKCMSFKLHSRKMRVNLLFFLWKPQWLMKSFLAKGKSFLWQKAQATHMEIVCHYKIIQITFHHIKGWRANAEFSLSSETFLHLFWFCEEICWSFGSGCETWKTSAGRENYSVRM